MARIAYHQLLAHDAIGETREVLDIGGRCQLTTSSDTVRHETLVHHGLHLGTGEVDGGRVGGRPGPDDNDLAVHGPCS